jgi:hypothetical protein
MEKRPGTHDATGTVFITVDNTFTLYVNGAPMTPVDLGGEGTSNLVDWTRASCCDLGGADGVLAVDALDTGGPASVLASFTGGAVSDTSWKCVAKRVVSDEDWMAPCYDDTGWPNATTWEHVAEATTWSALVDIRAFRSDASWIWTSGREGDDGVYCQVQIGAGPTCR